jgi:hypothetical protein
MSLQTRNVILFASSFVLSTKLRQGTWWWVGLSVHQSAHLHVSSLELLLRWHTAICTKDCSANTSNISLYRFSMVDGRCSIPGRGQRFSLLHHFQTGSGAHLVSYPTCNKFFSVCSIFTGCRLVTASNAVASSAFVFTFLLAGDCLTTNSLLHLTNTQAGSDLTPNSKSSHCRLKLLS